LLRDRVSEIRTLYARELRSALRERNIVINSIILPILLYPALLRLGYSGIAFVAGQSENLSSRVVLTDLPSEHAAIQIFLNDQTGVEILSLDSPEQSLRSGSLDVAIRFVEAVDTSETDLRNRADDFRVRLTYDGSRNRSRTAEARLDGYLSDYRQQYLLEWVREAGISEATIQQVWIEQENLATATEMGRFILGLLVPLLMVIMLVVGGCISGDRLDRRRKRERDMGNLDDRVKPPQQHRHRKVFARCHDVVHGRNA
jgi:ABC-type Na+ efflux pump permease subunit